MATLARLNVILGLTTTKFTKGLERAQAKLRRFGRNMDRTGRTMTTSLTVPMALAGAAAVKMSLSFEESMTKIITLVGVAEKDVNQWADDLIKLGPQLGKTPTELANALFQVTSASFRGAEAIDVLTYAAKGSNLGLGETVVVADAVTSAINAWGKANLNAADATAILRAAVKEGKAEAESIAPVIGTVANVAAVMGVEFHEVAAAIAVMTKTGAPAEIAVTQLSAILSTIQKGAPKTRKGLKGIGSSLQEVRDTLRGKGLIHMLTLLVEKMGDNEDAAAQVFGNVRALRGLFGLTGAEAEANAQIFANLAKVTGVDLNDGLRVVAEKSGFKLAQVFAQLASSAIVLGDALLPYVVPAATKLGEVIKTLTDSFTALDPTVQKIILALLGIATVAGPILVAIGLIATGLAAVSLSGIAWAAGIAGAAILVAKHWETLKKAFAAFVEFATPAFNAIRDLAVEVFQKIHDFAVRIWPTIQSIVEEVVTNISEIWEKHGATVLRVIGRAWTVGKTIILGALDAILGAIETLLHVINSDWAAAFNAALGTVKGVFGEMVKLVKASFYRMKAGWIDFSAAADSAMLKVMDSVKKVITAWMALPFIDPVQRGIAAVALGGVSGAMEDIAARVNLAKLESQYLNMEADRLLAPISAAKTGLVEMQGEWVTVSGAAKAAADETVISVTRAGEEIKGTLKGGFGKGVEEGVAAAKVSYDGLAQYVKDNPLRPQFDMEFIQRQFDQINRSPDTGGALP